MNNRYLQQVELIKKSCLGLEFLDREYLFSKIIEKIDTYTDKNLKNIIKQLVIINKEKYKIAPASEKLHHAYIGGLMQHTWETIKIAEDLFEHTSEKINRELVLSACVIHDFARMFELKVDVEFGIIRINDEFRKEWGEHKNWTLSWLKLNKLEELYNVVKFYNSSRLENQENKELIRVINFFEQVNSISATLGLVKISDLEILKQWSNTCSVYKTISMNV